MDGEAERTRSGTGYVDGSGGFSGESGIVFQELGIAITFFGISDDLRNREQVLYDVLLWELGIVRLN